MTVGLAHLRPGAKTFSSFAGLALFAAAACGGSTRQDATTPNGGKSGSDGRAGESQTMAGGTHSGGEASGAGGFGGTGVAGSPIELGGAGIRAVAGAGGATAGQAGVGGVGGTVNPCHGEGPPPVISGSSDFGNPCWKDSWFLTGCKAKDGASCATIVGTCPTSAASFDQQGAHTVEKFPIEGVPGQHYKVTFTFNALVEAKEYAGGTRDAGDDLPADDATSDTFYRDGKPTFSGHNVWRLNVYDDKNLLARTYFMNSFPPGQGGESERLFQVSYRKSIVLLGGGHIEHFVQDPDCSSVDNCGSGIVPSDACSAPRSLSGGDAAFMLPARYKDPSDGFIKPTPELSLFSQGLNQPWHSQLGHLEVIAIEATNDPATMDYPD